MKHAVNTSPHFALRILLMAGLAGLGGCTTLSRGTGPRPPNAHIIEPRVAVASFENRSGFSGRWELGSGMAELLVAELVASERFTILERGRLDTVVDEISRQRNRMFRPEGRLEEGRLRNAQYLIRGTVTDFSQVSGGRLWMGMRRWLFGGGGYTARVALTLTVIDIENGTILDSVNCAATARAGEAFAEGKYKGVSFGGDQFFRTPLGSATSKAIRQGLKAITRTIPRQYWKPMIADVNETHIILNGGRDRGVQAGQFYRVRERGTPITDPVTGDVLDVVPGADRGLIQVREVRDSVAIAAVFSGYGFARGQLLEAVPPPAAVPVADMLPPRPRP